MEGRGEGDVEEDQVTMKGEREVESVIRERPKGEVGNRGRK